MIDVGAVPQEHLTKVSKVLSFVLRHKPSAIGLELDPGGRAFLSDLLEKAAPELLLTEAADRAGRGER